MRPIICSTWFPISNPKMYHIKLLDLRLETNPSSSTPNTTWSIYDNGFTSNEITV